MPSGADPASFLTLFTPDASVASPRHLKRHPFASEPDEIFASACPPHTRVDNAAGGTAGIQAYTISQRGARKLLHRFGQEEFTASYDLMLRDWRDSVGEEEGAGGPVCVATQPPLFSQWYSTGGSDIHGIGGGCFRGTGSTCVRPSVVLNLRGLVAGREGLVNQFPDEGGQGAVVGAVSWDLG